MRFIHDIDDAAFRDPLGAVPAGTSVLISVRLEEAGEDCVPELSITRKYRDEESCFRCAPYRRRKKDGNVFRFRLGPRALSRPGVYYYEFVAGNDRSGIAGRITVYEPGVKVPDWFKNGVIYQIFPDRFAIADDPNIVLKPGAIMYSSARELPEYHKNEEGEVTAWDFYGGNLAGIREKLDYISGLGADTIYLNPIFESVSNHRYDTGDYEHVDGLLGGDKAFERFVSAMWGRGIRIILDGVFSHTGKESRYFKAALRGEEPYSNWYSFKDDGTYDCWWGVKDLPCVKELEPSYIDYTVKDRNSILRRWLRAGASGWRLDVADELPDEYLEELFKAAAEEKPDAVIFGEVWEDGTDKVSYGVHRSYFTRPELHSQTNYPFRERLLGFFEGSVNAGEISAKFMQDSLNYPEEIYYSLVNMTGSHDVERLFSCLKRITRGDAGLAKGLLKAYSLIQFCFPGVPLIYYGDEICMEGGTDPDNRRFFEWDNAGAETVAWFSEISRLRKNEPVLRQGTISFINAGDNVFAFVRSGGCGTEKRFVCAADRFGRGPEYILKKLENHIDSNYNIVKQAEGYAVLLETL